MHYWQRLFVEDGLYSDAWTPPFYPDDVKPGSDYMWDYRLVLPDYIQSLQRHVFAVSANTAEYQKQKLDDLANFGKFLFESVYEKIVAGFAHIKAPDPDELKYVIFAMDPANFYWYRKEGQYETFQTYDFKDPKDSRPVCIKHFSQTEIDWLLKKWIPGGRWIQAQYVLGTVERYSGYDCTATYPPDELKTGRPVVAFSAPTVDHDSNAWPDFWWVLVKNYRDPQAIRLSLKVSTSASAFGMP